MTTQTEPLESLLNAHIPYRVILMCSCDEPVISIAPQQMGTFFARQEISLIKIRDLFYVLTKKDRQDDIDITAYGYKHVKKKDKIIEIKDFELLEGLVNFAHKSVAHTTTNNDYTYEKFRQEIPKGIRILHGLLDKHLYVSRGRRLEDAIDAHRINLFNNVREELSARMKTSA